MARNVVGNASHGDLEIFVELTFFVKFPKVFVHIKDLFGDSLSLRIIRQKQWILILYLQGAGRNWHDDVIPSIYVWF